MSVCNIEIYRQQQDAANAALRLRTAGYTVRVNNQFTVTNFDDRQSAQAGQVGQTRFYQNHWVVVAVR